ncbi:MAG: P-loop NTPase [Sphingosinicella sp.]
MKHDRIPLIERAASMFDLGGMMRAPRPDPRSAGLPIEAPFPEATAPFASSRPAPKPYYAHIDRKRLARAGCIVPEAPATGLAEEFRLVKRQLLAAIARRVSLPEERRRSLLIASSQPGEGKSFCALNLALSLAGEQDVEVLLVDGDIAKPDLPRFLGLEPAPGLIDALADPGVDPESMVIATDVPGLSILCSGRRVNNAPELIASERTRDVQARLIAGDRRRIILFDSPPALVASAASVLACQVGQVLVVVRADRTVEADLRETLGLLSGCDNIALVLNGASIAVSSRKFGSYESYGHAA